MEITGKIKLVDNSAENIVIFLLEEDTGKKSELYIYRDSDLRKKLIEALDEEKIVQVEYTGNEADNITDVSKE